MKNNRSWQTGCSFTVAENISGHLPVVYRLRHILQRSSFYAAP